MHCSHEFLTPLMNRWKTLFYFFFNDHNFFFIPQWFSQCTFKFIKRMDNLSRTPIRALTYVKVVMLVFHLSFD